MLLKHTCDCHPPCSCLRLVDKPNSAALPGNVYCPQCCLAGFCFTLSTSLVTFPSLLVASLGGLLHNRLLERLEVHMEDTHCSESAMKTQATRKIPMLGHRECCRMRPPARVISPWFVLPLVLLLSLFYTWSCAPRHCCSSSPCSSRAHATHCSPCCQALQSSEEEQAALGGSSWLAEIPGPQGFLLDLRGATTCLGLKDRCLLRKAGASLGMEDATPFPSKLL